VELTRRPPPSAGPPSWLFDPWRPTTSKVTSPRDDQADRRQTIIRPTYPDPFETVKSIAGWQLSRSSRFPAFETVQPMSATYEGTGASRPEGDGRQ
jgi:hypothetical protein